MRKVLCLTAFLLVLLFTANAEEHAEWVFPENDPDVRFFVVTASSDDKNMLIYTMEGSYPSALSNLYLLNPATGVYTPLDFSKYADEEYAAQLIKARYAKTYQGNEEQILSQLFEREGIYDPYDYLITRGHSSFARLIDLRDDYALVSLPDYCNIIINLKTGEAYIPKDARALGPDGTYIAWDTNTISHYAPGGELIRTYLPELPEGASVSLARLNDGGSLAICAISKADKTFEHTFLLTDKKGNAEKLYSLNPSMQFFSTILPSADGRTYVVFNLQSSLYTPAYIIDTESDEINMLRVDSAILLDKYFYAAEKIPYDPEADFETKFIPLRINTENELIALSVTGDCDLIKIDLNTNEVTVLLTGIRWRELGNEKSPELFKNSQTLLVSLQSHNGSGILSVYPGGAIRHNP